MEHIWQMSPVAVISIKMLGWNILSREVYKILCSIEITGLAVRKLLSKTDCSC